MSACPRRSWITFGETPLARRTVAHPPMPEPIPVFAARPPRPPQVERPDGPARYLISRQSPSQALSVLGSTRMGARMERVSATRRTTVCRRTRNGAWPLSSAAIINLLQSSLNRHIVG